MVRNNETKLHVGEGNGMKKELNYFRLVFGIVAFAILATNAQVYAAKAVNGPGGHLRITGVFVDNAVETIIIEGEDFDFGSPLTVTLGDVDITEICTLGQTIDCDFRGFVFPEAGDYKSLE